MRWAWVVLLGCAAVGCVQPNLVACGDLLCSADSVCLESGQCASVDAVTACEAMVEGASCVTPLFTGACSGGACVPARCGDGIVEGSEQCDGAVSGVDCVDYGFDLGLPSCTDRCSLDVVGTCVRFGWRRILPDAVDSGWTDGTRFALISADQGTAQVITSGQATVTFPAPAFYFLGITGNAHEVVTWTGGAVYASTGGAFTEVDTETLNGAPRRVALAADDALYVMTEPGAGCTVYRRPPGGGAWSMIRNIATNDCEGMWTSGSDVFIAVDTGSGTAPPNDLLRYTGTGTTWTRVLGAPSTILAVAFLPGEYLVGTFYDGLLRYVGAGAATQLTTGTIEGVFVNGGTIYLGGYTAILERILAGVSEEFDAPITGFVMADGTHLYVAGNGVYEYTGREYSRRDDVRTADDLERFADGSIAAADVGVLLFPEEGGLWGYPSAGSLEVHVIAGRSPQNAYVSDGDNIEHWDGTGFSLTAPRPDTQVIMDLWAPPTGSPVLLVVGEDQLGLALTGGGAWQELTPPAGMTGCNLYEIEGEGTEILAAGTCGTEGVVWRLTGTTWAEVYRGAAPLHAIAFDGSGGVYAAGPMGGAIRAAGVWRAEPVARGESISATGPDDIWVVGGVADALNWNGTIWSRLRVVGAGSPRVVATPRAVYLSGVTNSVLLR